MSRLWIMEDGKIVSHEILTQWCFHGFSARHCNTKWDTPWQRLWIRSRHAFWLWVIMVGRIAKASKVPFNNTYTAVWEENGKKRKRWTSSRHAWPCRGLCFVCYPSRRLYLASRKLFYNKQSPMLESWGKDMIMAMFSPIRQNPNQTHFAVQKSFQTLFVIKDV